LEREACPQWDVRSDSRLAFKPLYCRKMLWPAFLVQCHHYKNFRLSCGPLILSSRPISRLESSDDLSYFCQRYINKSFGLCVCVYLFFSLNIKTTSVCCHFFQYVAYTLLGWSRISSRPQCWPGQLHFSLVFFLDFIHAIALLVSAV